MKSAIDNSMGAAQILEGDLRAGSTDYPRMLNLTLTIQRDLLAIQAEVRDLTKTLEQVVT